MTLSLRGSPGQFEVSVSQYAGETGILIFKLVSRGQPNAQVTLDQIAFSISDDPDHDGLTNAQEAALGTNPNSYDTDGDGWSDAYEINVSHTNPLLKDSDGDGVPDPQEVIAGTDPNDNTSVFAVKDIKRETDGSMTIRWNGQPSKTYQVQRSSTPGFESFDVIATKITGTSPLTSYTDPAANLQGVPSAFYRIEVE